MPTLQAGVSGQNVGDQWNGYPVSGPITSRFGIIDDAHPQPHSGNDVACDAGTLVRAPFAGQVVLVSRFGDGVRWTEIFGNSAVIRGEDGMRCLTAHYQDPPAVTVGQSVQAGDVLGAAGSTGQSTGVHVHIGLSDDSNPNFSKDEDGGVTRLLDAMTHLSPLAPAAPTPTRRGYASELVASAQIVAQMIERDALAIGVDAMLDHVIATVGGLKASGGG